MAAHFSGARSRRLAYGAMMALNVRSVPAFAHPGHDDDEIAEVTPEQAARSAVIRMVAQTKLAVSWTKAPLVETKTRTVKGQKQTVFTFRNGAERDKVRQALFVILDSRDAFVSADHILR